MLKSRHDCFAIIATVLRPCPFRTENSPAIYGWVHRPLKKQSPTGTTEIVSGLSGLKYESVFIDVHPRLKAKIAKRTQFSMQAAINQKYTLRSNLTIKAIQTYSSLGMSRRGIVPNAAGPNPSVRESVRVSTITPNIAYYRSISPNNAFFQEKKDCLFL
jgi:hypothetical protein